MTANPVDHFFNLLNLVYVNTVSGLKPVTGKNIKFIEFQTLGELGDIQLRLEEVCFQHPFSRSKLVWLYLAD